MLVVLAVPAAVQAQRVGGNVCPTNSGTINGQYLAIAHGDTKVYPDWFTRPTPATPSNAVTVTVQSLSMDQVNSEYLKEDGSFITDLGTATSSLLKKSC